MKRDESFLVHLYLAAEAISAFTEGLSQAQFEADAKTSAAVLYEINVIGEATRRLSESYKLAHPGIPWHEISSMRNHIVHEYDSVDWDAVWEVVSRDAPALREALRPLLPP